MRDRRQLPVRVGGVGLLHSPITAARKHGGLTLNEAAQRLNISALGLSRLEAATRQLPRTTEVAIIARLAGVASYDAEAVPSEPER